MSFSGWYKVLRQSFSGLSISIGRLCMREQIFFPISKCLSIGIDFCSRFRGVYGIQSSRAHKSTSLVTLTALSNHTISVQLLDRTVVNPIALLDRTVVNPGTNRFPDIKMVKYWDLFLFPIWKGL
jgi:hypothetical protein